MSSWLKKNWALVVLILIAFNWLKTNYSGAPSPIPYAGGGGVANTMMADSVGFTPSTKMVPLHEVAPTDSSSRLVIQDTSLSLQVNDVSNQISVIKKQAEDLGGFLVNSKLSIPDSAASGSISVRIPQDKLSEALANFKKLAIKVVSEAVSGTDVTDQYVDLESQLAVLLQTKTKYLDILNKATQVSDLMNVQQQLTNLQQQIDGIKGQQKYYEQSAKLTLVTIYLSTDELALPYAPTNEWRPTVVFKEAVRSLIASFRNLGSLLIWAVVYIPILIPVGLIYWYFKKKNS